MPEDFPQQCDDTPIKKRNQSIRIPSAFVNFAGLFAKVIADHLPAATVTEFWEQCRVYFDKIPDHAETNTSNCVLDARSLRSYSWYKW
jgi:hypothetical protein